MELTHESVCPIAVIQFSDSKSGYENKDLRFYQMTKHSQIMNHQNINTPLFLS